jgi:two-component system CheB/CheR fusion protein
MQLELMRDRLDDGTVGDGLAVADTAVLDLLFDHGPAALMRLDGQLRIVRCSPCPALQAALPSLWPALRPLCERALADGVTAQGVELAPDSAATLLYAIDVHPLRAAAATAPQGLLLVFTDLTERRRIEAERERALAQEQAASEAKDRFLAMLSHELRTPLTPVLLALQALERDDALSVGQREVLTMLRRNVKLEVSLIDDLLDLNRIRHGKIELRPGMVDLHEAIALAAQICEPDLAAKSQRLGLELRATRTRVSGDAARLQQVIWNLLKNSVKFSPEGETVTIRSINEGDRIVVEVIDRGLGIAPASLPHLFEPFAQVRLPSVHRRGGMGLGLTLGRSLAELHGGTLEATSEGPGRGACLRLSLPLAGASAAPSAPAKPEPRAGGQAASVLLVEDHEDSAEMMALVLRLNGWTVSVADSGAAARRLAATQRFDAIVSDIGLPDGSGLSLLHGLREAQRRFTDAPVPAIALSGYGMQVDAERSRAAGYALHLVKPVEADALATAITHLLAPGR